MTATTERPAVTTRCPQWCDGQHLPGFLDHDGYGFHQRAAGTAVEVPDSETTHGGTMKVLVEKYQSPEANHPVLITVHSHNADNADDEDLGGSAILEFIPAEAVKLRDALTIAIGNVSDAQEAS